jgi:ketosteroid isomerase-like protein
VRALDREERSDVVSGEENKALVRRWIEAYNERDLEAEADVLAPDLVVHVPAAPGPLEGLEAWRRFSGSFAEAFPDLRLTVRDIAAEGTRSRLVWTSEAPTAASSRASRRPARKWPSPASRSTA